MEDKNGLYIVAIVGVVAVVALVVMMTGKTTIASADSLGEPIMEDATGHALRAGQITCYIPGRNAHYYTDPATCARYGGNQV